MDNKRNLKRRELVYNPKIYDADADEPAGYLVDVNAQGIRISGTRTFSVGEQLDLAIDLPEDILGRKKVRFSARVQWSKPDLNPDLVATGMQFSSIPPADLETLIGLMARYSMTQ